jgi:anti-sigma factor RsiW
MSTQHLTEEQLSARLDGALAAEEQATVSDHLAACADCAARIDLLRATSQAVATLPPEEMPRPLDFGFLHERTPATTAEAPERGFIARIVHGRPPVWVPTAVAAAAVLVLAINVAPRLLPPGGGASQTSAGNSEKAVAPVANQYAAPLVPGGSSTSAAGAAPGSATRAGDLAAQAARKTVIAPDGSNVTLLANPATTSSGRPTQLVLKLVGAPSGTTLAPDGIQIYVSQGPNQLRLAGSVGAGQQVKARQELDLTAEWSAGAVFGPPAPGSYTLIGRVFLGDGRVVEVTLPFNVSPG